MTQSMLAVYGGVDTHKDTHTAAVVDPVGRVLGDATFPADPAGYAALSAWLAGHGQLLKVGVEGTGSYGAALATHLADQQVVVKEILRPSRASRRRLGKSDPIDAIAAAKAAAADSDDHLPDPKDRTSVVAAIATIRSVYTATRKDAGKTSNRFHALVVKAPAPVRAALTGTTTAQIATAAAWRPGPDLADPTTASKAMLRRLARRYQQQHDELAELNADLDRLTRQANPALRAVPGVGPVVASALLTTVGGNPHRMRSEASFAALCGVNPIPASSGKTTRHRLNRAGDRQANNALWRIATHRLRHDPATKDYAQRRTTQGRTNAEILRCLKRYIARQLYPILTNPPTLTSHSDLRPTRQRLGLTLTHTATQLGWASSGLSLLERGIDLNQTRQHHYRTWLHQQDQQQSTEQDQQPAAS